MRILLMSPCGASLQGVPVPPHALASVFAEERPDEVHMSGDFLTEDMKQCIRLAMQSRVVVVSKDPVIHDAIDHFVT